MSNNKKCKTCEKRNSTGNCKECNDQVCDYCISKCMHCDGKICQNCRALIGTTHPCCRDHLSYPYNS